MQTLFEYDKRKNERLIEKGVLTTPIIRSIDPKAAWKLIDRQLSLNGVPRGRDPSRSSKMLAYAQENNHLAGSFYFVLDKNKLYYMLTTSSSYAEELPDYCYEKELNLNNPLFQLVKQLLVKQNHNPLRFRYMSIDSMKAIADGKLNQDRSALLSVKTQLDTLISEGKETLSESERPPLPKLSILEPTELPIEESFSKELENMTFQLTYQLICTSLVEKMKDNFYQLFVMNPYEMGRAISNAKVGSFFYHLFGMVHALFSILADLAVEVTALVAHSVKQVVVSGYGCLFSGTGTGTGTATTTPSNGATTEEKQGPPV